MGARRRGRAVLLSYGVQLLRP